MPDSDQVRTEIKKLHQQMQSTVIYVTHDQVEAMTLADRIVIMRAGKIEQVGTPMDVYYNPANTFVATFIGSPAMNLVEGEIEGEAIRLSGDFALPVPAARRAMLDAAKSRRVTVGIRPQDLTTDALASVTDGIAWRAPVNVVEPLGGSAHLILDFAGREMVATGYEKALPRVGEAIDVTFSLNNLHLFDSESGKAL